MLDYVQRRKSEDMVTNRIRAPSEIAGNRLK